MHLFSFTLAIAASGCGDDDDGPPDICGSCSPGQTAYICNVPSSNNIVCGYDPHAACGLDGHVGFVQCLHGTGTGGSFPYWSPSAYIDVDPASGQIEVDRQLIDDIFRDGWVLMQEETARLRPLSGGYFQLEDAQSGDFAHLLGFQNGDIPVIAEGSSRATLKTWNDYATFITQQHGGSSFQITIWRSGNWVYNNYLVY
jgi:hypothetical protein